MKLLPTNSWGYTLRKRTLRTLERVLQRKDPLSPLVRVVRQAQTLAWEARASVKTPVRQGNIAMFHAGRSGSTVIADLLGQHPQVFWDGEIYAYSVRKWLLTQQGAADEASRALRRRVLYSPQAFYGFEVLFYQLQAAHCELSNFVEYLLRLKFSHFVVLIRKNTLRKIVSNIIAREYWRYHQQSNEKAVLSRIVLDIDNLQVGRDGKPKSLIETLENQNEKFKELQSILKDQKVLRLTYEDDVEKNPYIGYRRICEFLNIDYVESFVRCGKTNPFSLKEIIQNFAEVERTLQGTPFNWMLYD